MPSATVPRISLAEDFTGWNCGPCASHNPAWTAAINAVGYDVVAPAYVHVWWPTADDDPMYRYCEGITGPQGDDDSVHNRVATMDFNAVPMAFVDGANVPTHQSQAYYEGVFNNAASVPARVAITTSGWVDSAGMTATVSVQVEAMDPLEPGDYRLMIELWEDPVTGIGSGTNGETTFNWAVWRMLPDGLGTDIGWSNGAYPGDKFSVSYTVPIESTWDIPELGATVFVQNFDTLAVEQAAVELFDGPMVELVSPEPATPDQIGDGLIDVEWIAHDTQDTDSTLDIGIEYSIDGGNTWNPIYSGVDNNDGIEPWDSTLFPDSPCYELRISATDSDGNTAYSFSTPEYFTIDNVLDDRWYFQMQSTNSPPSLDMDMKPAQHLLGDEWYESNVPPSSKCDIPGAGDYLLESFASEYVATAPMDLAGTWNFSVCGYVFDDMTATPDGHLYARIYGDDGFTTRLLRTTVLDDESVGTFASIHQFTWQDTIPAGTILNPGERVIVDVYMSASSGVADATYDSHARKDIPTYGTVTNDYTNTQASDNQYEILTEDAFNPNPLLMMEDFSGAWPPAGWTEEEPTGNPWQQYNGNLAGGAAPPEALFYYLNAVNTWRLYYGPIDTTGMTDLTLTWANYYNDYGPGVDIKVETSSDGSTWQDTSWVKPSGNGDIGPGVETTTISTSDVGSSTFYLSFTVDGNAYQLDYWLIDDIQLQDATQVTSKLEHKWYTYIPPGETTYELYVEARRPNNGDGDNFQFEYSADDVSYTPILMVNSNTEQVWTGPLPAVTGPVYIRVVDTDRTLGNDGTDSIRVDELFVRATGPTHFIITLDNPMTPSYVEPSLNPSVAGPYSIDLAGFAAGDWAFVSFPIDISGNVQDILNDATLGDGQTTWDIVKWYDATDPADPWKTYNPAKPAGLNDLLTIDNTMGVWIHLTANSGDQVLTTGQTGDYPAAAVSIPLYTGWNLVSYPSATARQADTTLPAQADMIAVYDGAQPYWVRDVSALNTVTMTEGNAYWVHVTSDTTWTVNP